MCGLLLWRVFSVLIPSSQVTPIVFRCISFHSNHSHYLSSSLVLSSCLTSVLFSLLKSVLTSSITPSPPPHPRLNIIKNLKIIYSWETEEKRTTLNYCVPVCSASSTSNEWINRQVSLASFLYYSRQHIGNTSPTVLLFVTGITMAKKKTNS